MKYGIVFLLLGLVCGVYAWTQQHLWMRIALASIAVCFIGVGLGFLCIGPGVFLKRADGRLTALSYLMFWPYHLLNWLSLMAIGRTGKENVMDEIVPNLYLGRRLTARDKSVIEDRHFEAVLDLTSEFSRSAQLMNVPQYKCIPLLDTFAPTSAQLEEGVKFLNEHIQHGPVYVHCAMGHGRSATFVAAYLIASGQARDAQEAEELIKARRPLIGLHPVQTRALENFGGARNHAD